MISANAEGVVRGQFTIPENVPVGTKAVSFRGKNGSFGQGTFTGSGTIEFETLRRVNSIITERYDPLAQTFTLQQSRFIAGVELWFKAKGKENVQVQIREVLQGTPTQTVLAESDKLASDIHLDGAATLFEFTPVFLEAGQEYAIVILTDGAEHAVAIAELGKFDANNGWVTSQPYQVGVLLSSSNASTWTPHQDKDLTFNLKAAKFKQTTKSVFLGDVSLNKHSDLMALAVVQRPAAECDVEFEFQLDNGDVLSTKEWSPKGLEQIEGINSAKVFAKLSGSETLTPILFNGTQVAKGKLAAPNSQGASEATYVSRQFSTNIEEKPNQTLNVTFEGNFDSDSGNVKVEVETAEGVFQTLANPGKQVMTGQWRQFSYQLKDVDMRYTRVKLTLMTQSESLNKRPQLRNLRAFTA